MKANLNIAICDDDLMHRQEMKECLVQYSKELGINIECVEFLSGERLLESEDVFDVLFLDIEMDGISGIEAMRRLLDNNNVWRIIFVSSHKELVYDVFGLKTLGFIRKPIEYDEIKKWMDIVVKELININIINFDTSDGQISIKTEDILYFQADKNNVLVITRDKLYEVKGSLKNWEEELLKLDFIRVHRSFIVNMAHIDTIRAMVMIKGKKQKIPVGRKYERGIKNSYSAYVMKKVRERR